MRQEAMVTSKPIEDRLQILVNAFDASELSRVAAAWKVAETIDGDLPSLLVEAFPLIRKWQGRASILRYIGKFSRESDAVFNLGLRAIQDKAYDVRHYACALLAYSLRTEALPIIRSLLQHSDGRTVQDARAAMDAIQNKNHHFFKDRDHSGRIKWEYGSV